MLERASLFLLGGGAYAALELAWRGTTHWTMFLTGGVCLCLLQALADRPLQCRHLFRRQADFLKLQRLGILPTKHAVDHGHMEVEMGIEQATEAVDENHCADVCCTPCFRQALPQAAFDAAQQAVEDGVLQFGVVQVVAQALGEREHPLPYRQARKDVVGEVRRGLDHAPGGAGGTDATAFAGVGDNEIVPAVRAAGAGKAVGEDATFEVAAEFALGQHRCLTALPVIVQRQPGGEVRLYHAVEERAFGLASVIDGGDAARVGSNGGHGHPDRRAGCLTVCPSSSCVHPVVRLLDKLLTRPASLPTASEAVSPTPAPASSVPAQTD